MQFISLKKKYFNFKNLPSKYINKILINNFRLLYLNIIFCLIGFLRTKI